MNKWQKETLTNDSNEKELQKWVEAFVVKRGFLLMRKVQVAVRLYLSKEAAHLYLSSSKKC